ncbi:MAG: FAD-dependent oxidoreductase [Magnetococcales bacterium]|nr:FAD-dependent oxidoreductase [Magnetococcales bacterium]
MPESIRCDLCIIGAGSGGLSVAAGASQMGSDVVLLERERMGGDCLNTGCVPSKALLAAGHVAQNARRAEAFGIRTGPVSAQWEQVRNHVHDVIGQIAPHDSVERFEGLGVRVIQEEGRFLSPTTVQAGSRQITARRFVIATGSRPAMPTLDGLSRAAPLFTNENIFDNREPIGHLIVIGGGPIGLELAQAHRRLGAQVTVLVRSKLLPKDDPEASEVVRNALESEGVTIHVGLKFLRVERRGQQSVTVVVDRGDGKETSVEGTHLLVAAGRTPNIDALTLDDAGIEHNHRGITVTPGLRTSNHRVYAIGDVAGPYQFTHMAGYQAGIVIRSALFRLPAKVDYSAVPWVTYTDPELAHVGLSEQDARQAGHPVTVLKKPFTENDRARAERATDGFIKVILGKKGRILGATLVGIHAGELLQPWTLAIQNRMKIGAMATAIAPYPTLSDINKGVAGSFYTPSLFSEKTRKLVRFLSRFG